MADWTFPNLTTAVSGVITTTLFAVQSTADYTQSTSNGTVSVSNLSNLDIAKAIPVSSGKRPVTGMVFPRGVYNK